jgi:hypothetical protein
VRVKTRATWIVTAYVIAAIVVIPLTPWLQTHAEICRPMPVSDLRPFFQMLANIVVMFVPTRESRRAPFHVIHDTARCTSCDRLCRSYGLLDVDYRRSVASMKTDVKRGDQQDRFEDVNGFERHMSRNSTVILRFFLHVSNDEQRKRLLKRIRRSWKGQRRLAKVPSRLPIVPGSLYFTIPGTVSM